jgi:hypothetical protein
LRQLSDTTDGSSGISICDIRLLSLKHQRCEIQVSKLPSITRTKDFTLDISLAFILKKKTTKSSHRGTDNTDRILKLYEIYDSHRDAVLWFLEELDAKNYEQYLEKYSGASSERSHFIAVCGFFELSGVPVSYGLIDQNLYFDIQ